METNGQNAEVAALRSTNRWCACGSRAQLGWRAGQCLRCSPVAEDASSTAPRSSLLDAESRMRRNCSRECARSRWRDEAHGRKCGQERLRGDAAEAVGDLASDVARWPGVPVQGAAGAEDPASQARAQAPRGDRARTKIDASTARSRHAECEESARAENCSDAVQGPRETKNLVRSTGAAPAHFERRSDLQTTICAQSRCTFIVRKRRSLCTICCGSTAQF